MANIKVSIVYNPNISLWEIGYFPRGLVGNVNSISPLTPVKQSINLSVIDGTTGSFTFSAGIGGGTYNGTVDPFTPVNGASYVLDAVAKTLTLVTGSPAPTPSPTPAPSPVPVPSPSPVPTPVPGPVSPPAPASAGSKALVIAAMVVVVLVLLAMTQG